MRECVDTIGIKRAISTIISEHRQLMNSNQAHRARIRTELSKGLDGVVSHAEGCKTCPPKLLALAAEIAPLPIQSRMVSNTPQLIPAQA
jgi:hypothetical protein